MNAESQSLFKRIQAPVLYRGRNASGGDPCGGGLAGRRQPITAVTQTAQVERGDITETIEAIGIVAAMPSASITWESGGIVSSSTLKVGDQVEKGEVLLTLDDSSISPEILQARSSLLEAQAEFEKMTSADTDFQAALEEVTLQETISCQQIQSAP